MSESFVSQFQSDYMTLIRPEWLIEGKRKSDWRPWEYGMLIYNASLKDTDKILDIGCGESHLFVYLAERCSESWGIDNATFANFGDWYSTLSQERRNYLIKDNAKKLPFHNEYFDKIFTISALEHFDGQEDSECSLEVYRCLRVGGIFTGTVDYHTESEHPFPNDPIVRTYTEESFRRRILDVAPWKACGEIKFPKLEEIGRQFGPLFFALYK